MKRLVAAAGVAITAATGIGLVSVPPATAAQDCVTRNEFVSTKVGWTLVRTEFFYETHGRLEGQGGGYKYKSYPACYGSSNARVYINYRHYNDAWRIESKYYSNGPIGGDD